MHVETADGKVVLKLGRAFAVSDAERVVEILKSLAPIAELIVDFTDVHEFQDAAFPSLFEAIGPLAAIHVALRGLTPHQSRLLEYLGLTIH